MGFLRTIPRQPSPERRLVIFVASVLAWMGGCAGFWKCFASSIFTTGNASVQLFGVVWLVGWSATWLISARDQL